MYIFVLVSRRYRGSFDKLFLIYNYTFNAHTNFYGLKRGKNLKIYSSENFKLKFY